MNDEIKTGGGFAPEDIDTQIKEDAQKSDAGAPEETCEAAGDKGSADEDADACGKEARGERKKIRRLESEIEGLKKQLADAEESLTASSDKYYRMLAEYDNFRKRSAKEKECSYSDAYADALSLLLPVIDNLERARGYTDAESVAKGLELTLRSFEEALGRIGVEVVGEAGESFDPNLHNAVFHLEDEAYGESEIVEVLQKGYVKGERVIRYAMVKVAN